MVKLYNTYKYVISVIIFTLLFSVPSYLWGDFELFKHNLVPSFIFGAFGSFFFCFGQDLMDYEKSGLNWFDIMHWQIFHNSVNNYKYKVVETKFKDGKVEYMPMVKESWFVPYYYIGNTKYFDSENSRFAIVLYRNGGRKYGSEAEAISQIKEFKDYKIKKRDSNKVTSCEQTQIFFNNE